MASLTTFVDDGTAIDIGTVNTPALAIETLINDLLPTAMAQDALNDNHVSSLLCTEKWTTRAQSANPSIHTYSNKLTPNLPTDSGYNISTLGDPGWAVIDSSGSSGSISEILNGTDVLVGPDAGDRIAAMLVMGNVHFWKATVTAGDPGPELWEVSCAVGIQYRYGASTWVTIPRSVRFMSNKTHQRTGGEGAVTAIDIPICCLVQEADILPSQAINGFRLVVAWTVGSTAHFHSSVDVDIDLLEHNMSVIPLHASIA
jgi:hypothetical protein